VEERSKMRVQMRRLNIELDEMRLQVLSKTHYVVETPPISESLSLSTLTL
jgi:hypothetical protein